MQLLKDHVICDASLVLEIQSHASDLWPDVQLINWRVANTGSSEFHGVLRVQTPLPPELSQPWFLIPGFLYGENRREGNGERDDAYPRFDPAISQPRRMTSNHWDFAADRTAYPLVYAWQNNCCFAFAPAPHVELDRNVRSDDWEPQVSIGLHCDGRGGYTRLTFPACEEPFTYSDSTHSGPTIRRVHIPPGAGIRGRLYRFHFSGSRHDYQRVLEFYWNVVGKEHTAAQADEPLALMRDAVHGIVHWHYHPQGNYFVYSRCYDRVAEQIANSRGVTLEWHQMNTGFVNGLPVCWGLAAAARHLNDHHARHVARQVATRICRDGLSPSGLFWADFRPGVIAERNGTFPNPLNPTAQDHWGSGWWKEADCVHARTIADANWALANFILEERTAGCTASEADVWQNALRANVEAILLLQLPSGSYGAVYDAVGRTMRREAGCGGLLWIPALLAACKVFQEDLDLVRRMEESACLAGDAYAAAVEDEHLWGAPEDNDSPTSEDGLNAVLAYHSLYQRFGRARDLRSLQLAAEWMLTFRKCYNVRCHARTLIGAYGLRSKGGDFASASNNHQHIFEVLSTAALYDLSRWTGRPYFRQRAMEHWAYAQQLLCRVDGQFNGFRGGLAEQFYWTNWSSFGQDTRALEADGFRGNWDPGPHHRQKGNLSGFSTIWCVNVILLGANMMLAES